MRLLYSEKEWELDELIKVLNPRSKIQLVEYYSIVSAASAIQYTFDQHDLNNIYKVQNDNLVNKYEAESNWEGLRLNTEVNILKFKVYLELLRVSYERDENSYDGLVYKALMAKGNPLSDEEKQTFLKLSRDLFAAEHKLKLHVENKQKEN